MKELNIFTPLPFLAIIFVCFFAILIYSQEKTAGIKEQDNGINTFKCDSCYCTDADTIIIKIIYHEKKNKKH